MTTAEKGNIHSAAMKRRASNSQDAPKKPFRFHARQLSVDLEVLADVLEHRLRASVPRLSRALPASFFGMARAGAPTAVWLSGMSLMTTALAPIFTLSPTAIGPSTFAPVPM